jgi:hypothetical protein
MNARGDLRLVLQDSPLRRLVGAARIIDFHARVHTAALDAARRGSCSTALRSGADLDRKPRVPLCRHRQHAAIARGDRKGSGGGVDTKGRLGRGAGRLSQPRLQPCRDNRRGERQIGARDVFQGTVTEVKTPDGLGWFFPGLEGRNDIRGNELVKEQVLAGAYAARSGQQVNVNVEPAANPGGTAIVISEPPIPDYSPVTGILNFGNYGNRFTGGYQAGGNAVANLTHGLQLTASYVQGLPWLDAKSRGSFYSQPGVGISSVTPWGIYGFSANGTHFREGNVTAPLFPVGNILSYSLNGTQLLYADTAARFSITEALNRTTFSETVLEDAFTILQQRYNWVSLGNTYSRSLTLGGQPGNITGGATVNLGVSTPSGTLFRHTRRPDPAFSLYHRQRLLSAASAARLSSGPDRPGAVGLQHPAGRAGMDSRRIWQFECVATRDRGGRQRLSGAAGVQCR